MAKPSRPPSRARSIMLVVGVALLMGMGYLALKLRGGASSTVTALGKTARKQLLGVRFVQPPAVKITPTSLRLVAKAMDPEVMQHSVPEDGSISQEFKNPCWKVGDALRCLPYVYILGGFQSGANTLFAKLSEHPDIVTNEVSRWQFWAEDGKTMSGYVEKHSMGPTLKAIQGEPSKKVLLDGSASTFAFYWSAGLRAHRAFQAVMVPCWHECSVASKGKKEQLRSCTAEKCYPRAMAADVKVAESLNMTYDDLHLPLLMSAAYGGTFKPKLIMLMRNPVDRVHCAYWQYPHYQNKYGKNPAGFLAYVKEQVGSLKACAQRFVGQVGGTGMRMDLMSAERHCVLYFEALGNDEEQIFFHADQFMRGMYSIYVEVWLRHFTRESILPIRSETYFTQEEATVNQVITFLGLSDPSHEQLQKMLRAGKPSPCTRNAPPMLPEAEQILRDLFQPYNTHLAKLLNDPQWLDYNKPRVSGRAEAVALML